MEIKQLLPIIISVIALLLALYGAIVSTVNSYYQFFYVSHKVRATVLECRPNIDGSLSMKIVFSNLGNKEMILESAQMQIPSKDNLLKINDSDSLENGYNGKLNYEADGMNPRISNKYFPKLLKPGDLYLVEIIEPFNTIEYFHKHHLKNIKKVPLGVHFRSINSRGQKLYTAIFAFSEINILNDEKIDYIRTISKSIDISEDNMVLLPNSKKKRSLPPLKIVED